MKPFHHTNLDLFEEWAATTPNMVALSGENYSLLSKHLSSETDCDSYISSPAYYAFTGRRGLWIYHFDKTILILCRHPNVEGQILIFPPLGQKNYNAITSLINQAPTPQGGFHLARFKPHEIAKLKTWYAAASHILYKEREETVLDWKYPARVLSTLKTSRLLGHNFMYIRNRLRQAQKHAIEICPLTLENIDQAEALACRWAKKLSSTPEDEFQRVAPYKETIRLFKNKELALSGLTFVVNGQVEAVTMWDFSNERIQIANLFMNLCNTNIKGLSETSIVETAKTLYAEGIDLLNLGGSETEGLDRYKNKFNPAFSVSLCSLDTTTAQTMPFLKTSTNKHHSNAA